ncbi:MAG: tetratricopeptide repeat protein, partial [Bryobacteraceae bacterium]
GLDFPGDGRAAAIWDFDLDGDLDLLLKFRTTPQLRLMRNEAITAPRALTLELAAAGGNSDAIGARVTLETSAGTRTLEVHTGSGFLSQSSRRLHFGLPQGERPLRLSIRWPDGATESFDKFPKAGLWLVEQGRGFRQIQPKVVGVPERVSRDEHVPASSGTWLLEPLPAPALPPASSSLQGKFVLLNFWAEWCPPCRKEISDFSKNIAALRKAGADVLVVSVDKFRAANFPFPVVRASEATIGLWSTLYRNMFDRRRDLPLPATFLIEKSAVPRIVRIYSGATSVAAVVDDLEELKSGRVAALPFQGRWFQSQPARNYTGLATAMAEAGFNTDAENYFEFALSRGYRSPDLLNNYAGLLLAQGKQREADAQLRKAVDLAPNEPAALGNLATLLVKTGKPEEAERYLRQILELRPDDIEAYHLLNEIGVLYAEAGRTEDAVAAFERAARSESAAASACLNLALLYLQSGDVSNSRRYLEEAKSRNPDPLLSRLLEAQILLQEGKRKEAAAIAQELLRDHPDSPEARELLQGTR